MLVPLQAIADSIHRRLCPLYSFGDGGTIHMSGSAVPFIAEGTSFLLTATHVCLGAQKQPFPLFTWGSKGPRALTNARLAWSYERGAEPDADISLIALSQEDAADLKSCYDFTDAASVSETVAKTPGVHYLIAGYPAGRNRVKSRTMAPPAMATYLITGDIRPVGSLGLKDKSDSYHFGLSFKDADVRNIRGDQSFRIPKPHGMSGGGVWRLTIDPISKFASIPVLVGVGIEFHQARALFVATHIRVAIPLIADLPAILAGTLPLDVTPIANVTNSRGHGGA